MEPMALDVLFEGATILTMVDNAPVVTGDVGVREGRIALVGQAADPLPGQAPYARPGQRPRPHRHGGAPGLCGRLSPQNLAV